MTGQVACAYNLVYDKSDTATGEKLAANEALMRFGSKRDVAAMLQLSVRSVDNLVAAGCPVLRIGKRRCRFDLAEVAAWLKARYGQQRRRPARTNATGGTKPEET